MVVLAVTDGVQKPPLRKGGEPASKYRADVLALVALAVAAAAWPLRGTRSALLGGVLILSLAVATAGVIAGIDGYPWSNVDVLAGSVTGGILLGRLLPARARPMGVLRNHLRGATDRDDQDCLRIAELRWPPVSGC